MHWRDIETEPQWLPLEALLAGLGFLDAIAILGRLSQGPLVLIPDDCWRSILGHLRSARVELGGLLLGSAWLPSGTEAPSADKTPETHSSKDASWQPEEGTPEGAECHVAIADLGEVKLAPDQLAEVAATSASGQRADRRQGEAEAAPSGIATTGASGCAIRQACTRSRANALVFVDGFIPSLHYASTGVSLTMDTEVWSRAREECRLPRRVIVGWYHSHPGFGAFFSGTDRRTHHHFFPAPFHIGLVLDPIADLQSPCNSGDGSGLSSSGD